MTGLGELIEVLMPHVDTVVHKAAGRAKRELPTYEGIPELEIREGIAHGLGIAIASFAQDRELTDGELAEMGRIGDARARQEVPLEDMLRVYRFTLDAVFEVLWDASERGELEHADALRLTRQVWLRADYFTDLAAEAYRHRELTLAVADTERRAALVNAVLFSPAGAPPAMVADAGVDPSGTYVAIRGRGGQRLLSELQLPGVLDGGAVAAQGGDAVGFAAARPRISPAGAVLGVGPPGPLGELPRSLAIATRVVDAANAAGRTGVLTIDDVALEAIARSEDTLGDALVRRYVASVDEETLGTVRAHLDGGFSADRTAERLGVHPNTVRNRLHRFESLTGASLRSVDDLALVRLALLRAALANGDGADAHPHDAG